MHDASRVIKRRAPRALFQDVCKTSEVGVFSVQVASFPGLETRLVFRLYCWNATCVMNNFILSQ